MDRLVERKKKHFIKLSMLGFVAFALFGCSNNTVNKDTILFKNPNGYTARFISNADSNIDDIMGFSVDSSPIVSRNGYNFLGWYLTPDFEGDAVIFPFVLNKNQSFYAKWESMITTPSGDLVMTCPGLYHYTSNYYLNASYGDTSFNFEINVVDENIYKDEISWNNDNIELIFEKRCIQPAGLPIDQSCYKILIDCGGNAILQKNLNEFMSWGEEIPLPNTIYTSATIRTIENDGYIGYSFNINIDYNFFGLTKDTAIENISFALACRNTDSDTISNYLPCSYKGLDIRHSSTHLILKENGEFETSTNKMTNLLIGDTYFDMGNYSSFIPEFLGTNVYSIAKYSSNFDYWINKVDDVVLYNPDNLFVNLGCSELIDLKGVEYIKNKLDDFINIYRSKLPNTNLYFMNVYGCPNFSNYSTIYAAFNYYIKEYCVNDSFIKCIDLNNAFKDNGSTISDFFQDGFIPSFFGYQVISNCISNALNIPLNANNFFGSSGRYITTRNVDLSNENSISCFGKGTSTAIVKDTNSNDFVFKTSINVESVYDLSSNGKIGVILKSSMYSLLYYIPLNKTLSQKRVQIVYGCNRSKNNWSWKTSDDTYKSINTPDIKYTGLNFAQLDVRVQNNMVSFYLDGSLKHTMDTSNEFGNEKLSVGIYGENAIWNAKDYYCEVMS